MPNNQNPQDLTVTIASVLKSLNRPLHLSVFSLLLANHIETQISNLQPFALPFVAAMWSPKTVSLLLAGLLALPSAATKICTCEASDGVSQDGFSQILDNLNINSHDQFCVNAPDYDGCYTSKSDTQGSGNFYGCGIFCADENDSGACLWLFAYTAYLGANTGGCISKSDLIDVVNDMASDAQQYDAVNCETSEMSGGGFRVQVSNGFNLGGGQCDPGVCVE
ncbi:uncharacterized protein N7515_010027 [Penicillium bovifimosum]|uniref:Uncharacterized protein n=1 Tax=Penicillium bovifimosum TaxID=126998 RepID=A0A9W9KUW5_9EURO|nr:uncharacterized protein N7515_010027 [Penicillium bovifimosum]KAJ5120639.1 hypothetical protein N7515_010027 [Penicillium bovifimosum]